MNDMNMTALWEQSVEQSMQMHAIDQNSIIGQLFEWINNLLSGMVFG